MASKRLLMRIKVAWWFKWYCLGVVMMAQLTGRTPDEEKIKVWINRAITAKLVPHDV